MDIKAFQVQEKVYTHYNVTCQSHQKHNMQFSQRNRTCFSWILKWEPMPKECSDFEMYKDTHKPEDKCIGRIQIWKEILVESIIFFPTFKFNFVFSFLQAKIIWTSWNFALTRSNSKRSVCGSPAVLQAQYWQHRRISQDPEFLRAVPVLSAAGLHVPTTSAPALSWDSLKLSAPSAVIDTGWEFIFIPA